MRQTRRPSLARALRIVVVLEVVAVLAVGGWWILNHDDRPGWLVFDRTLRGSVPPENVPLPDLSVIDGLAPAAPAPARLSGKPVLLAATCARCQSGDIMGGFLRRLSDEGVPSGVHLMAVVWGPGAGSWHEKHRLPPSVTVHAATDAAAQRQAQQALRVGDSGVVFLHGRDGNWASTYHMAQLTRDDVAHDLRVLNAR